MKGGDPFLVSAHSNGVTIVAGMHLAIANGHLRRWWFVCSWTFRCGLM